VTAAFERMRVGDTRISDDGLRHLSDLTSLEFLYLEDAEATVDGVKMLQESLPNCDITELTEHLR